MYHLMVDLVVGRTLSDGGRGYEGAAHGDGMLLARGSGEQLALGKLAGAMCTVS